MMFMEIIGKRERMRELVRDLKRKGVTTGFVPTMGFLHEGHLSLVRRAREENGAVIVSIFVNPAQFGPGEDYDRYPRDLERDCKMLEGLADYVFVPEVTELFGKDGKITFEIRDLTQCLCGLSRPHHFPGVLLVLAKLFNIIKPDRVYLGQKDYQQTVAVRHLVNELFFDTGIVVCPTVREADGLAMSSRNKYLAPAERAASSVLREALVRAEELLKRGEKDPDVVIGGIRRIVDSRGHSGIDYVDIREADTLKTAGKIGKKPVVVALAVNYGKTRLIDNIVFKPRADA
jgi:pantoate--beta-alanine ligase